MPAFPSPCRSALLAACVLAGAVAPAPAQQLAPRSRVSPAVPADTTPHARPAPLPAGFRSLTDSLEWARAREAAEHARGRRLVVSLRERTLWWIDGQDTLRSAPVAVGKGSRLEHGDTTWDFSTPRGARRVLGKARNPVWIPPEWHYVELAQDSALTLVRLERGRDVPLADGSRVGVRGDRVGRVLPDGRFEPVPADEEVVFGDTLFVPPLGTANRRIEGELGAYKLDLGDGYLLHGTPHKDSIGRAATHGCIRLRDEDIEYLYRTVPVGTRVFIY